MRYSFPKLVELLAAGGGQVLATVIETEDSTPQVPGASAIFASGHLVAGTVGGGVMEARIREMAADALRDGRCRLVRFSLDAEPGDKEGALCGGAATVLIDPLLDRRREMFAKAWEGLRSGVSGVLASRIVPGPGDEALVDRAWLPAEAAEMPPAFLGTGLTMEVIRTVLAGGRVRTHRSDRGLVFIEPVRPLPGLVIAGAGHIGKALAHLGSLLDFRVTVVDDRPEFANRDNVPDADTLVVGDIGASMRTVPDSPDNYFVVVTRGHELDAEALRACLGREAAYVGMIGSRKKVEAMRREFLDKGWATEDEWDRVHTPIGLVIGSKTVEEIAVSIAAELVLVRSIRVKEVRP